MELQDIQHGTPDEVVKKVMATKDPAPEDVQKQYDPKKHKVADTSKRPDKLVTTDDGKTATVEVARLPIPLQKRIVRLAAAFLCGNPIQLSATPDGDPEKNLLEVLKKTWKDNKLDYKSKKLAKHMLSETECAEIWYTEDAEEGFWTGTPNDKGVVQKKLRMKILAPSLGDALYPVFNSAGDMIAFGRGYSVKESGKKAEHFDLYTADKYFYFSKGQSSWELQKEETNIIKKIPVIYYNQPEPEWTDVQDMIDRQEKLISNHADTNDYHASPTVKVKGKIVGFSKKGESGKIIELEGDGADADYMAWNHATDSIKLEFDNLEKLIYGQSSTPNISFEQMKGLGTFSGIALKMLFMDAHMKASDKEEIFGECIQRRINYLKRALAVVNIDFESVVNMEIEPVFNYYMPKNDLEVVEMLTTAVTGGIISRKTAVSLNPLVQDAEAELKQIEAEANSPSALDSTFN